MKKLNIFLFGALFLLAFSACEEKERPFPEYDDIEHGAYGRLIDGINGIYDFFALDDSAIDFTVEFYDDNQGMNVAEYNWQVTYIKAGEPNIGPVDFRSFTPADWGRSERGLPTLTATFAIQDALAVLGLTNDDVEKGNTVRFDATIVMTDGRTFSNNNTGTNVRGGAAFRGLFRINQPVICPSNLASLYDLVTTDTWCGNAGPISDTISWKEVGVGVYEVADFSFGAYAACYGPGSTLPGGTLQIQDACNTLSPLGSSRWGEIYTFEEVTTDGSSLTIVWTNDYGEGGTATFIRTDGTDWPPLTN
ncbi:MAG: hypothetical protein WBA17_01945 [Saprospiraceae bacterium]